MNFGKWRSVISFFIFFPVMASGNSGIDFPIAMLAVLAATENRLVEKYCDTTPDEKNLPINDVYVESGGPLGAYPQKPETDNKNHCQFIADTVHQDEGVWLCSGEEGSDRVAVIDPYAIFKDQTSLLKAVEERWANRKKMVQIKGFEEVSDDHHYYLLLWGSDNTPPSIQKKIDELPEIGSDDEGTSVLEAAHTFIEEYKALIDIFIIVVPSKESGLRYFEVVANEEGNDESTGCTEDAEDAEDTEDTEDQKLFGGDVLDHRASKYLAEEFQIFPDDSIQLLDSNLDEELDSGINQLNRFLATSSTNASLDGRAQLKNESGPYFGTASSDLSDSFSNGRTSSSQEGGGYMLPKFPEKTMLKMEVDLMHGEIKAEEDVAEAVTSPVQVPYDHDYVANAEVFLPVLAGSSNVQIDSVPQKKSFVLESVHESIVHKMIKIEPEEIPETLTLESSSSPKTVTVLPNLNFQALPQPFNCAVGEVRENLPVNFEQLPITAGQFYGTKPKCESRKEKNRLSAQKSRIKQKEKMQALEEIIVVLKKANNELWQQNNDLKRKRDELEEENKKLKKQAYDKH